MRRSGAAPDFPCVKVKQGPSFETYKRIVRLLMHLDRLTAIMEIVAIPGRGLTTAEVQKAIGLLRSTHYQLLHSLAKHRLINAPVVQGSCRGSRGKFSRGDPQRIHKAYKGVPQNRIRTDRRTALSRMRSGNRHRCVQRSGVGVDRPYRRIDQYWRSRLRLLLQVGLPQRDWGGTATERSRA